MAYYVVAASRPKSPRPEELIRSTHAATAGGCGTLELYKKGRSERSAETLEMAQSLQPEKGGVPVSFHPATKYFVLGLLVTTKSCT